MKHLGGMDVKLAIFSCDKCRGDKTMNLKTLILMSVVALSSTPIVRSETLDQIGSFSPLTYNFLNAAISQFDVNGPTALPTPYLANFATAYDNFTFTSSGVISNLSWIGQYETGSTLPTGGPNFQVRFYTSLGATAGSAVPVATYNIGTANEIALTGAGLGFHGYSTALTPFNVTGGTQYFVSIVAQMNYAVSGWGLAFSSVGGDDVSVQDFGATTLTRFNDTVDYAISVTAVPEPGSVFAILTVVGLVAVRRQRLAKKLFLIGE